VDEANLQQLTGRGVRIDEQAPGHGLGLAIVHDIVRLYDGHLAFSRSERLGGLCVRVDLPAAAGT
jgi:signal transduction histidine kinase